MTVTSIGRVDPIEYLDPGILVRKERPSRASDIWSLGITLHHALARHGVYGDLPDNDPLLAIRKVIGSGPEIDASLEGPARALIEACLDPEPAHRPPSALSVAEAIDAIVRG